MKKALLLVLALAVIPKGIDAEAAHWYRLAAEQGNVRAQNDLTQRDWPRPAQEPILDEAGMARCAAVQQFAHGLPHLSQ